MPLHLCSSDFHRPLSSRYRVRLRGHTRAPTPYFILTLVLLSHTLHSQRVPLDTRQPTPAGTSSAQGKVGRFPEHQSPIGLGGSVCEPSIRERAHKPQRGPEETWRPGASPSGMVPAESHELPRTRSGAVSTRVGTETAALTLGGTACLRLLV